VGQAPAEICDGLDNNCNGAIDEGLGTTTCGIGVCQVTVDYCVGGQEQTCTPNPGAATAEVCDGEDNNCDGEIDEVCQPIFDVLISFSGGPVDPIEICFTPDKPLNENADPSVSLIKPVVNPDFSEGTVPPRLDPCSELLSYCVPYTPNQGDSEVEIRIDEDPTNPVIPGYPGFEIANFLVGPDYIQATSFCIDNGGGGSGFLQDPCNMMKGVIIEFDPGVLVDGNGDPLPSDACSAIVRIVEVDPSSIPPPPDKGLVLMFDVSFVPEGVLIKQDMTVKVTLRFELPPGLTQQEFEDHLQVLYYDIGDNPGPAAGWKADGISNPVINWDTMTISFLTNHFTTLAAFSKQSLPSDPSSDNYSEDDLQGRGCSLTAANYHMSLGSGIANTLIMFIPLVVLDITKRRIQKKRKNL